MSRKVYNFRKCIRNNGITLALIIYYRKILNKAYNYLVLGRLDTHVDSRAKILGLKNIKIGKNSEYNGQIINPQIIIGDNVSFSEFNHVGATSYIEIGNNVLFGSKCYVTDHNHGVYKGDIQSSVNIPPANRDLTVGSSVVIEDHVWVGDNVVILPNVKIGYGSIIGANSVVTKDIPPCSIAVGAPIKVIKTWNNITNKWENV